jgi:hypothetical protein
MPNLTVGAVFSAFLWSVFGEFAARVLIMIKRNQARGEHAPACQRECKSPRIL